MQAQMRGPRMSGEEKYLPGVHCCTRRCVGKSPPSDMRVSHTVSSHCISIVGAPTRARLQVHVKPVMDVGCKGQIGELVRHRSPHVARTFSPWPLEKEKDGCRIGSPSIHLGPPVPFGCAATMAVIITCTSSASLELHDAPFSTHAST
jgi:hypothetical protein